MMTSLLFRNIEKFECYSWRQHAFLCYILYWFSIAAVTNNCNNTIYNFYSSVGQKPDTIWSQWVKIKMSGEPHGPWRFWGEWFFAPSSRQRLPAFSGSWAPCVFKGSNGGLRASQVHHSDLLFYPLFHFKGTYNYTESIQIIQDNLKILNLIQSEKCILSYKVTGLGIGSYKSLRSSMVTKWKSWHSAFMLYLSPLLP